MVFLMLLMERKPEGGGFSMETQHQEKKEKKPEVKARPVKNARSRSPRGRSLPEKKKPQEEKKADKSIYSKTCHPSMHRRMPMKPMKCWSTEFGHLCRLCI